VLNPEALAYEAIPTVAVYASVDEALRAVADKPAKRAA